MPVPSSVFRFLSTAAAFGRKLSALLAVADGRLLHAVIVRNDARHAPRLGRGARCLRKGIAEATGGLWA